MRTRFVPLVVIANVSAVGLKIPVLVSDEKVILGEAAEPFPVKTAMMAKCVKVYRLCLPAIYARMSQSLGFTSKEV
jgi:hypothetical protein